MAAEEAASTAGGSALLRLIVALGVAALFVSCEGRVALDRAPVRLTSLLPPTTRVEEVVLRRSLREALVVAGSTEIEIPIGPLRWRSLRLSLGARRQDSEAPAKVAFEVRLATDKAATESLDRTTIELAAGEAESPWREVVIDLTSFGDERVRLSLVTTTEDASLTACWGAGLLFDAAYVPPHPPVILISIDTLGTSHMGLAGYGRDTTPRLAEFAADAVTFEQAITHQTWTLTAHASLLTSLHPDTHRVSMLEALPASDPLLPDLLQEHGYFAIGLVNNPYLSPGFGYGRAYDVYDFRGDLKDETGRRVNRTVEESNALLDELLGNPPPAPFFLFYHLIDVHSDWRTLPYESPEPFASRYLPEGHEDVPLSAGGARATAFLGRVNDGGATLDARQVEVLAAQYDGGVAYTDHHLGRFFDGLRARGLYEPSLIIVTSDHGEEFAEHGKTMHVQAYEECLRVPLLVKLPGNRAGGRAVATQVQHLDVVPTVLDVLGLPVPPPCEGHSLLPVIDGAPHPERIVIAKGGNVAMTPDDEYVARTERAKLLWWPATGRTELYDLVADPAEQVDLAELRPELREELLAALVAHRGERDQGFRLRIPAHREDGVLTVRLSSDAALIRATLHGLDASAPPRWSDERRTFSIDVSAPEQGASVPFGIDFDLAPGATHLALEARLAGRPLPAERLLLGAQRQPAAALPARLVPGDPVLDSRTEPALDKADGQARLQLWESRPARGAAVELSDEEREALRALGYVDGEDGG